MNIRRITSLTAGLSFILLFVTIVVLYIVPQGRVAYWADWRLWGLTKEQWGNIHIKQIARQNDMAPADVYALMRQIAAQHDN